MRPLCLALSLLCWLAATARAEPAERALASALEVELGDGCLEQAALVEAVATWLGRATVPARLSVTLGVEPTSSTVRFVVAIDGAATAVRTFPVLPAACPDRRAALGLAIALAIDHAVLRSLGITEPAAAPPAAPPAVSPPRAAELPPPRAAAPRLSADAGVVLLAGVLARPAPAGRLAVELDVVGLRLRAGALATLEQTFRVGSGRTRASLIAASLEACLARDRSMLSAGLCVGSAAGQLRAQGSGDFLAARSARLPWAAASGGLFGRLLSPHGYGVRADLVGLVPYVRPRLEELDTDGDVLKERTFPAAGILAGMSFSLVLR